MPPSRNHYKKTPYALATLSIIFNDIKINKSTLSYRVDGRDMTWISVEFVFFFKKKLGFQ